MATLVINNGTLTQKLAAGTYTAVATTVNGYSTTTLDPTSITVSADSGTFAFKIGATGTATITLTDSVTTNPIAGATFIRCDATDKSKQYGTAVTTNASGVATFNNLPWGASAPAVNIVQLTTDSTHQINDTIQSLTLQNETGDTFTGITNNSASDQVFTFQDANYTGLPITGTITLT